MTGRELILYILSNKLEDEEVFKDGKLVGFRTIDETAVAWQVGTATIQAWIQQGWLDTIKIGDTIFIPTSPDWINTKLERSKRDE